MKLSKLIISIVALLIMVAMGASILIFKTRGRQNLVKTIELQNILIMKEAWPPFSYVLQGKDGLRFPLAGKFPPMEKTDQKVMNFGLVSVSIEIAKYDQREYFKEMHDEKDRIDRALGMNTPMFQYLNGVPPSDFNWYVQITSISIDGQTYQLGGALERNHIYLVK